MQQAESTSQARHPGKNTNALMEKQKEDKSTRKLFKERKLTKKGFPITKRIVNRVLVPKKTQPHSQPNQQLHTSTTQPKGRMCTTIQRTTTYVRD